MASCQSDRLCLIPNAMKSSPWVGFQFTPAITTRHLQAVMAQRALPSPDPLVFPNRDDTHIVRFHLARATDHATVDSDPLRLLTSLSDARSTFPPFVITWS